MEERVKIGDLEIDFQAKEFTVNGNIGRLTNREAMILRCLAHHKYPINAYDLADCVYKDEVNGGPNSGHITIRTQIFTLRRKMFKVSRGKQYIDSYGWSGYRLRECNWVNWKGKKHDI